MTDARPLFTIKNNFQKGGKYEDYLNPSVLVDICMRVTGENEYDVVFDNSGYNIGRLLVLDYAGGRAYISLSEPHIRSRNSSFQSLPSALSRYILDPIKSKRICFYMMPNATGNFETNYFIFMYRLMRTAGVELINIGDFVSTELPSFSAPSDIVANKDQLRAAAKGNKSSYVTRGESGIVQVYAKTYGANKYESTLLCLALAKISLQGIELYEVPEGGLTSLPDNSRAAIEAFGKVTISVSTDAFEIAEFQQNDSLRSIRFIYGLFERHEKKHCAFCDCEVPQIVQGAHIWPVASIKKTVGLSLEEKLRHAIDGHNGLWLCENHHKLFDAGLIYLSSTGAVKYQSKMMASDISYLKEITKTSTLPNETLSPSFLNYLQNRNLTAIEANYLAF